MTKKPVSKKGKQEQPVSKPAARKPAAMAGNGGILGLGWGLVSILGISSLLFLVTRIQLLAIPFERDEGSFAYIGHWLFKGREMYTDLLDSKLPGLYIYYGTFMSLFGYGPTGAHVGLLVANLASAVCFYFFLRDVYNRFVGAIATTFFLWMVVSPNVVGFAAHATQLLLPFVLAGLLFFWKGLQQNKLYLFFLSGLMIGLAFTIKQQSAIFGVLIAALWWPARLAWNKKKDGPLPVLEWILLGIGGFLPAAAVVFYFLAVGRFDQFLDWTVMQPITLASAYEDPWYVMFYRFVPSVIDQFELIWITAAAGMGFIFLSGFKKFGAVFGPLFALLGFLSVIIGAAYYKHYFVLAIPGIAMLAAITLNWLAQKIGQYGQAVGIGIATLFVILSLRNRADYYFSPDYYKIHFEQYAQNMFPELEQLGKDLARRVPEGKRIAIMGSEPEVLVAADRESCSKHLMVYSLLIDPVRSPPKQQEYIQELKACDPEYIVWATGTGSWAPGYDKLQFFETLMQWIEQNYETVGLAESRDARPGIIVWEDQIKTHQTQSDYLVLVLKKRAVPVVPTG